VSNFSQRAAVAGELGVAHDLQAFLQAAEGIRTLDLLHGKQ
jgi:hypothetical protein